MPWADEATTPAPPETTPPPEQPEVTTGRWAEPGEGKIPAGASPIQEKKKLEPEMPGVASALFEGVGAGFRHASEGIKTIRGVTPEAEPLQSPAAQPLEWSDATSPFSKALPKLAYGVGESAPTLAGGLAGGLAGSAVAPGVGTIAGGALGAGAGAALQTIGPYFSEELKQSPKDPDGAWTKAVQRATASGAFSALGWGLFGAKAFEGPVKQLAFQALGIQPGVSVAGQATQNAIQGKPLDENLGQAAATGAIGTAIPMAGHAILSTAIHEAASVAATRAKDPILSRLGDPEDIKSSGGWRQKFQDAYTAVKDDLNPFKVAENYLMEGKPIDQNASSYIAMRLTRGSYGKAEHFIDFGTFDPITGKNNGDGLKKVLAPVQDDLDGFRKYMMARRAVEKDAQGVETGIPIAEAKAEVASGASKYAQPFNNWLKYQDNLLNYLTESGLVGKDAAGRMRAMNKDYVPFYRLMDEPQTGLGSPGAGLKTRNPVFGMDGSERKILDPIESTIRNTYLYLSLADRNIGLQKFEKLAQSSPRGNEIMQKVKPEVHPVRVTGEETEKALTKQGLTTLPTNPDDFTIFRPNAFRPAPDQIRVYNNGKPTTYKVDPRIAEAVNHLDRQQLDVLTKMMSYPAKLLRAGATLSPEFIARNPIRDQFSAFIFSTLGRGYVPFYDMVKGMGQVLTHGKSYQDWLKSGGANSAMVSVDRNYVENLVRRMKDPTITGTIKNVVKSPVNILQAASELMENATRVGENMRLLKRGATLTEAGYAAREVTLDFQRMGAKMQGINSLIAFFNAQVEGVDRMFRSMKEQPLGFAAKVMSAITLPSVYLWAANKDDPRMKEIPRWEKDIFWIVPTDNWQPISAQDAAKVPNGYARQKQDGTWEINKGSIWRIPKPFELGVAFGSVPERILDAYHAKNPKFLEDLLENLSKGDFASAAKQTTNIDSKGFKGVGSSVWSAFMPGFIPQAASPLIEQYANNSIFTGRPLVPKYMEDLLPQYKANPYTTDTAKAFGQFVAKLPGVGDTSFASPIVIENYIRAWGGGLARHALDLSDAALHGSGLVPSQIKPTLTNADKPLLKAFSVRFPEAGVNSVQDFYEEFEKRNQIKKTATFLRKTGAPEEGQALLRENVLATADKLHKAIGAQMKLVRDTYRNPKMTPDEKRQFIDMTYFQVIKMAQIGNQIFKTTQDAFDKKKKEQ